MVLDEDVVKRNLRGLEALPNGAEGPGLAVGTSTRLQCGAAGWLQHCAGVVPVVRDGMRPCLGTTSCGRHCSEPRTDILGSVYAHRTHLSGFSCVFSSKFSMAFCQLS